MGCGEELFDLVELYCDMLTTTFGGCVLCVCRVRGCVVDCGDFCTAIEWFLLVNYHSDSEFCVGTKEFEYVEDK